jgi:sulfite exporter TauE/SafE
MANLFIVFLTGLTTGGLSCLAVQGGLLASSVAHQTEQNLQKHIVAQSATRLVAKKQLAVRRAQHRQAVAARRSLVQGVTLFLGAKLMAYTLLGFFLGWLGSVLQLTARMQAITQLAVGVFMVGTALRMLNVHPFFRYFVIEPPSFVTRYIRKQSKAQNAVAPLFLGLLTVLIPCGVTQVMMATAVSSGDPLLGAGIMFAFTLGTSPLFFTLAYLASRLGEALEARFMQVAAVIVFTLGFVSINGGLNLLGSPYSLRPRSQLELPAESGLVSTGATLSNVLVVNALDYGYQPNVLLAPAEQPVQLKLVTNDTWGCTRAFVIPDLNIQTILPDTGETIIDIPPQPAGTTLFFTCSMGMFYGQIQF